MKTITEIRNAFWVGLPEFKNEYRKSKRQNEYNATIRSAFVMYLDSLSKSNQITESLVRRATL